MRTTTTTEENEMRSAYGQVYATMEPVMSTTGIGKQMSYRPNGVFIGYGFRGVLYKEGEGQGIDWEGVAEATPEIAFEKMQEAAKKFGTTDLRPWSGDTSKLQRRATWREWLPEVQGPEGMDEMLGVRVDDAQGNGKGGRL